MRAPSIRRLLGWNAERFKAVERVGILSNQSDQRRRLLIRLAAPLLPTFKGPRIDTNLEREHLPRHVECFASLSNEIRIYGRNGDGFYPVSPQRQASLAMRTHGLHARDELAEEATLLCCLRSPSALGHRCFLPCVLRLARSRVSFSIAALR